MATVLYINEKFLTDNTNLSSNIDIRIILPSILIAQDKYISKFLGIDLDSELKEAIINNTLTTIQIDLLKILKKAQSHFTCYEAYPDILIKFMNQTVATGGIQNGTYVSKSDLIYMRDIALGNGNFYLNEAKIFIKSNITHFPTWKEDNIPYNFKIVFDSIKRKPFC